MIRTYKIQTVARAAAVPVRTVTLWTTQGKVTGLRSGARRGIHRTYSFGQMMEVAVAAEILRLTTIRSVEDAFEAARAFAKHGGFPWHPDLGATLLIMTAEGAEVRLASRQINPFNLPDAALLVNAGAIFATICGRIAINPEAAYLNPEFLILESA